MQTTTRHSLLTALCLLSSALCPLAIAQQVAQPSLATTATTGNANLPIGTPQTANQEIGAPTTAPLATTEDDIVQLGVFQVTSTKDIGYAAADTTAGARVRTSLRDTAASISPFTQEFLNDIGATTIDDVLSYGANIEQNLGDDSPGFDPVGGKGTTNDSAFRIRGLNMSTALDGVNTTYSSNQYNIERTEISSGPNSILFGMGNPGGMVNLISKRANLQRNRLTIQNTFGTWTSPAVSGIPYYRATLDYNLVLIPRTLAFRLLGMYQKGDNTSWRKWLDATDKRITPTITLKPFKNTTINALYEAGQSKNHFSRGWNAGDGITGWLEPLGTRGILESIATNPNQIAPPGIGLNSTSNNRFTFADNGPDQTMYNFKGLSASMTQYVTSAGAEASQRPLLPPELSSFYYSPFGPAATRDQKFDRIQVTLDQSIGNLNIQLGYYHAKNTGILHDPSTNAAILRGETNRYLTSLDPAAGPLYNTNAGRLYIEDAWELDTSALTSNDYRATAEYTIDLKKYGRHRIVAMAERAETETLEDRRHEILLDQNNRSVNAPDAANGPSPYVNNYSRIFRRHYVTEGDFSTYYAGDWTIPIAPFPLSNGNTYHAQYVADNDNMTTRASRGNHAKRTINTGAIVLQDYLLNNTLVTTFGLRVDAPYSLYQQTGYMVNSKTNKTEPALLPDGTPNPNGINDKYIEYRITDPADPRYTTGQKAWGERVWDGPWKSGGWVNGQWQDAKRRYPVTYSLGAVYHTPLDWLSAFVNFSSNRGVSDTANVLNVLPDGGVPPMTIGKTVDFGVMLTLSNNLYLRAAHFDTRQLNQIANSNNTAITTVAGFLADIYSAFHYNGLYTNESAPGFNAMMTDSYARGYEVELNANLLPKNALTLRFTLSYTDRARDNLFKEQFAYYNARIPAWLHDADPNTNGGNRMFSDTGMPLYQYILTKLYDTKPDLTGAPSSIRDGLSSQLLSQSGGFSTRPLKFNFTAKYSFKQRNWLQGFALGAGVRYNAPNSYPDPNRTRAELQPVTTDDHPNDILVNPADYVDTALMLKGNSWLFYDGFISYKAKLFGGRATMTLQFNISNLFNQNVVTIAQMRQIDASSPVYLFRTYLNPPRTFRLSATFDF